MDGWHTDQRGSLLVEVMLAIALFSVVALSVMGIYLSISQTSKQSIDYVVATGLLQEGIEATRSIRTRDYAEIINGTHGLDQGSGYYSFTGTSDTIGGYTRTITIEDVYRTGGLTGDIAASGTLDANTKKVTVNVTWGVTGIKSANIDAVFYVYNLAPDLAWTQTALADFTAGKRNSSGTTSTSGGEVTLANMQGDWSDLEVVYEVDLAGNGDRIAQYLDRTQDILYVLSENTTGDELVSLDVSDVSQNAPTVIDGYDVGGASVYDFVIHEGYAYIATNDLVAEVHVVDVSTMALTTTIDLPLITTARGVAVGSDVLVVGTETSAGGREVLFYDVADPLLGIAQLGDSATDGETGEPMRDVVANDEYAFVASTDNTDEIFVFRLSDYSERTTINLDGTANIEGLYLNGDNLYAGKANSGGTDDVFDIDVADPESPGGITSDIDSASTVYDVATDSNGEFLFAATSDNSEELTVVELAGFTESQFGDTTSSDNGSSVVPFGDHVFLGTDDDAADLVMLATTSGGWSTPSLIGSDDKSGTHNASAIYVDGSFTYLATESSGSNNELFIYDTSVPSSPALLGTFNVGATVNDIVVSGDYAFLATDGVNELDVLFVQTKTSPCRVAQYAAPGGQDGYSVAVLGDDLYLGRDRGGGSVAELTSFDVSSLPTTCGTSALTPAGSLQVNADLNDLAIDGGELYAATDRDELYVFDVSTPSTPLQLTTVNLSGGADAEAVAFDGEVLVLGRVNSGDDELVLMDISTMPSGTPTVLGSADVTDTVNSISLQGTDFAYLASDDNDAEFQRWNIQTTSTPTLDGVYDVDADAHGVVFDGTYAYLATEHDTLELQILGEGAVPSDFAREGTFTSQAFDSGASSTSWSTIEWTESGTGSIAFRIRTASSLAGLDTATWVGSDGTSATTYSTSGASITTDPGASGTQYVQWKAFLSGSGASTPSLEDVSMTYAQ